MYNEKCCASGFAHGILIKLLELACLVVPALYMVILSVSLINQTSATQHVLEIPRIALFLSAFNLLFLEQLDLK